MAWSLVVLSLPLRLHLKIGIFLIPLIVYLIDRYTSVALYLFLATVPLYTGSLGGELQVIIPALLILVYVMGLLSGRWRIGSILSVLATTLAVLLLISLQFNSGPVLATSPSRDFLTFALGLGLCVVSISVKPRIEMLLVSLSLSSMFVAIIIVAGKFEQVSVTTDPLNGQLVGRPYALGLNPNYLGLILTLGIISIAGLSMYYHRWWLVVLTTPLWFAIAQEKSRTSIILIAIGLFMVYIVGRKVSARISTLVGAGLALALWSGGIHSVLKALLGGRINENFSSSDNVRFNLARLAIRLAVDHPLIGVGYGNFPFFAQSAPSVGILLNAHDDYLRVAAEAGIPALILLVSIFVIGIKSMRRIQCGSVALAVLVVYMGGLFTIDALSSLPLSAGIWILIGSSFGLARAARRTTPARGLSSQLDRRAYSQL